MATCDNFDLKDILGKIDNGKIQLPEFQREWTWDDNRIRGIITSLTQNYPMGSVMCLEYGGDSSNFKYRTLEGVITTRRIVPDSLILDGQQRLTSIYRAMFSKDPVKTKNDRDKKIFRFYYLDINACLDNEVDRFDAVLSVSSIESDVGMCKQFKKDFDSETVTIDLSMPESEYMHELFPLNIVFDTRELNKWMRGYLNYYDNDERYVEKYDLFVDKVLESITNYKLPVITLDKNTPQEAVCKVFENVNTGGVELTVFDLMTAKFARNGFYLRDDWEKCRKSIREPKKSLNTDLMDGVSETDFLTAVTLYASYMDPDRTTASCKRKDVLALSLECYKNSKKAVLEGYRLARDFLVGQCILFQRDLPYNAQITPLAAICAVLGKTNINRPETREKLSQWFWCGILGEMYGSATDTRSAIDIEDVLNDVYGRPSLKRTVNAALFSCTRLLSLQNRSSAAYKGILALLYKKGCVDFMSGTDVNIVRCIEDSPDIHHIFPKAYCEKRYPKEKWNSIVNKTALLPASNRQIGKKSPSTYSNDIMRRASIDEMELRRRVESNFVNYDFLKSDDFNGYFIDRAKKLIGLIEDAMGKEVGDKDSAETINQFGGSLL